MANRPVKLKHLPRTTVKAKSMTRLMGQLVAGDGITIVKENGASTISVDTAAASIVTGPASATDNAVPRFNGVDGTVLQNSGVVIDDSNVITGGTWNGTDIAFANLAQGSALSVLGVAGNATADHASIAAASDFQVMRRSGASIGFGAVDLSQSGAVGTSVLPAANGGTGTATAFTEGSVVFAGSSGVYAQDNASLFWNSTTHALGLGTTTLQTNARLTVAGNVHVTAANPMFALPNYTFDISAPTGHASFAIDSITIAPDGNALMVQSISSGAGISSGGAGYFGVVNNSTGGGWDGYGTFHVLNTPNAQSTPAGVALWGTLRGERALGGTALDGTRSTNEMSYDAVVTFNTATEAVIWPNHALQVNDEVAFTTTGALPTGLVVDTKYFVKTILDASNFTLAAAAGGALILLSGSPSATTTIHVYQNPARGLIVFNSTKYNAFNWGLQIPSAVQYGVQVGDVAFSATHIIPTHPFSFFNGDATPKELFFVNNDGTVNLKAASNVNTRFLNMKASSDADTAIMAISMQNASGTDKMLQWTDATSATYRFKSAGPMSLHTNNVAVSAAGAAITIDTAQAVQFNAYGAGYIKSDASGNLTSSLTISGATIDGASNTITHAGKSALALRVNRSASQTPSAGVWTKIQLNVEASDPNSWFDNATNYRLQPNVACVLILIGATNVNVGLASYGGVAIYKNGTEYDKYLIPTNTASDMQVTVPAIVSFNGTTDYVELFGFSSGASPTFAGGAEITKLDAYQLY